MNLDKKLAKYAKQIRNPKYYGKILDILDKADETNYQFKDFSLYDLEYLTGEIEAYYNAIQTDEDDKRMIKYCNSYWFVVSDKKYVIWKTAYLWIALSVLLRAKILVIAVKIRQRLRSDLFTDMENVSNDLYLFHGAIKAAEFIGCDVLDLDKETIEVH